MGRLQRRCCCWGSLSLFISPDIGQRATKFFLQDFGMSTLLLMSRSWLVMGALWLKQIGSGILLMMIGG